MPPHSSPRSRDYNPYNYADSVGPFNKSALKEAMFDDDAEQFPDGKSTVLQTILRKRYLKDQCTWGWGEEEWPNWKRAVADLDRILQLLDSGMTCQNTTSTSNRSSNVSPRLTQILLCKCKLTVEFWPSCITVSEMKFWNLLHLFENTKEVIWKCRRMKLLTYKKITLNVNRIRSYMCRVIWHVSIYLCW